MNNDFDTSTYALPPKLDAARAIALGRSLETAAPAKLAGVLKQPLKQLSTRLAELQAVFAGEPVPTVDDRRPADRAVDTSVAALHGRLSAYASLPAAVFPKAAKAAEAMRTLFPEGLAFLRLNYTAEWAEIDKLQRKMRTGDMLAFLEDVVGKEFIENLDQAQDVYGRALGITTVESPAPVPMRAEKLRAFNKSLKHYAFSVLAQIDEDDAEVMDAVRQALQPIDAFRVAQTRRVSGDDQDGEGEVTEVDARGPDSIAIPTPSPNGHVVPPAPGNTPS